MATTVRAPVGSCCGHCFTAAVSASSSHASRLLGGSWAREEAGESREFELSHDGGIDGWMDGWMI